MAIGNGSRSNSRSGRASRSAVRLSQSKLKQHGDGAASSAGGHPFNGPDSPQSPTKRDIKHRFEITKKLGSGTYGKVSLAFDHKTEREVAVKLIKKSAIENKQDLVRIRREIRIMSALTHPNIIQIYEVFENKEKIIIVMEYASGGELYDYVSTYGSLPEPEARRIFRQITSAVLYCHKHRVAHRDLKLENILLDTNSSAKIADFGLSNYFSDKSLLTTFCGSPLYASPEIINGTPYRGPEVDCWSLGILLYTLVYGSMPFDGRDFNRMVRQIKRGAYFEPDTPSTASMLIRNMLRVNPDRRSDIDEIASHWWLNLEENMPVIQELPENQIIDHTPLTERAETMIVQDLADETDVFMEFGHLSSATRKKIEEFRRRRKEAEDYLDQSPVQPKSRKTDDQPTMTSREKNLREVADQQQTRADSGRSTNDPLERLRALETRLQTHSKDRRDSKGTAVEAPIEHIPREPSPEPFTRTANQRPLDFSASKGRTRTPTPPTAAARKTSETPPVGAAASVATATAAASSVESKKPAFVALDSEPVPRSNNAAYWRVETDSLNMLMNQVLEQMEKGPVSMNLVARIKAHPFYDNRPMVKELLESIMAAQPPSVQEKATKILQQQSQDLVRRQFSGGVIKREGFTDKLPDIVPAGQQSELPPLKGINQETPIRPPRSKLAHKAALEERPWHSVEVGFDPDEQLPTVVETTTAVSQQTTSQSTSVQATTSQNLADDTEEETVRDTSFEDQTEEEAEDLPSEAHVETQTEKEGDDEEEEEEEELEDEEEYDSDFEELAEEVEEEEIDNVSYTSAHSQQESEESGETAPPPDPPASAPAYMTEFDRGLAKRQSKGKYGLSVDLYGRGVSTEEGTPQPRRRIGGAQPLPEQAPYLFDKAKKYILEYPNRIPDSDDESTPEPKKSASAKERQMNWLRTQDPDVMGSSVENASHSATPTDRRSAVRSPPINSDTERDTDEAIYAAPSTQTNATSMSTSITLTTPTLERNRGANRVYEAVPVVLKAPPLPRKPSSNTQSAPPSVQNTPSPDRDDVGDKHYVTVAELKLAQPTPVPMPLPMPRTIEQTAVKAQPNSANSNHFSDRVSSPPRVFTFNERRAMYAKSPTPEAVREFPSTVIPENETVSSYIRRKNRERERRQRNRTIGAPEEVFAQAVDQLRSPERHTPTTTTNIDALLSPRSAAAATAETIDVRTDPKRVSYRSAIQQSQASSDAGLESPPLRSSLSVYGSGAPGESRDSSFSGHSGHYVAETPQSPSSQNAAGGKVDPFYAYHTRLRDSPASGSLFNYVRPRYHDDSYRKSSFGDTAAGNSPAKFNQTSNSGLRLTSEERAKSRSMHELTPDRPTESDRPSSSSNETRRYGQTPSYTSARRHHTMVGYEDEVPSSLALSTWATEPKRYEVYQTRAERQAERNTSSTNYPSYRPPSGTAAWYESQMRSGATAADRPSYTPGAYRSRFDDNFLYRRSAYDVERDSAATEAAAVSHTSRFRPPRRVTVALGEDAADITRNAYNRSQSVDRRLPRGPSEERPGADALRPTNYYSSGLSRNRLLTPEVLPTTTDYAYVSYHDSSGLARGSQPREPPDVSRQPARGILKNKQSADAEPRAFVSGNGRGLVGGSGSTTGSGVKFKPVTDMFDRLKRHLSAEKSVSPAPRTSSRFSSSGSGAYASYESDRDRDRDRDESPRSSSKKRSILSLARRRTSEIRLGSDGKMTTTSNGYSDMDDSKRPSSPLEKIKGLFRRSKDNLTADHTPMTQHHVASASVSPHRNYSEKVSSYTSPSTASYTPQYRKYDRSYVSRYSYTPSSTSSATPASSAGTRHWYEDNSHMY